MFGKSMRWLTGAVALATAVAAWSDGSTHSNQDLMRATQSLKAAEAAERQASQELAVLRTTGRASLAEISEYEAFLDGLRRRVARQRRTVIGILNGGSSGEEAGGQPALPRSVLDDEPITTDEERLSNLDGELDASLGEFDEMLLREQEKLAARTRPERSDTGAAAGGDATGAAGESEAGGMSGDGWEHGDRTGEGEESAATTFPYQRPGEAGVMTPLPPADSEGQTQAGGTRVANAPAGEERRGAGGGAGIPPDIPDGKDDDVVARQLREAAMNEGDPVLREKLWDEYRKYKGGNH